jgi:hypothetical protein
VIHFIKKGEHIDFFWRKWKIGWWWWQSGYAKLLLGGPEQIDQIH